MRATHDTTRTGILGSFLLALMVLFVTPAPMASASPRPAETATSSVDLIIDSHGKQMVGVSDPGDASSPAITPDAVGGSASAFISWVNPSLYFHGNAVGWPRGDLFVMVQTLSPQGVWGPVYVHRCYNSTSCSSPERSLGCPTSGKWWVYVDAGSYSNVSLPTATAKKYALVAY